MKDTRGFTLIETIVYIALLALLMSGTLAATYELLQGNAGISGRAVVQDEENFVMNKIGWALGSIDPTKPFTPSSGYSSTLSLTRYDGTQVGVRLNGTKVEISEDGGTTYVPITTDNVAVSTLQFQYLAANGTGPAGIVASTTMGGFVASTTRYIRK